MILAAGVITLPIAACDDFTANGNAECHTNEAGLYVCTASSTATPKATPTPAPPTTAPPTTTNPPTTDPKPPVTSSAPPSEPVPDDEGGTGGTGPTATTTPPAPVALTAAERFGWGTPLPGSDEFNYTGAPDPNKWTAAGECWAGHAGNGKRCASNSTVNGGALVQTGEANGDSAWLASKLGQQYGRWEARVRTEALSPDNGRKYHPLLIVWPDSNQWPNHGEYDFFENQAPGQDSVEAWLHYPHNPGIPVQQEHAVKTGVNTSEWHNIAFEWTPTHIKGFIDGVEFYSFSDGAKSGTRGPIQAMPSGHLTIQLDNFFGADMQEAKYEVDWARIYAL